jgi:hypothetical protein
MTALAKCGEVPPAAVRLVAVEMVDGEDAPVSFDGCAVDPV